MMKYVVAVFDYALGSDELSVEASIELERDEFIDDLAGFDACLSEQIRRLKANEYGSTADIMVVIKQTEVPQ